MIPLRKTHVHDRSYSALGTGNSIKRDMGKLVLWAKTFLHSEMKWSC